MAEIRALLLKHKVLFFRDQDITRAEHVAFARHFGELEDHPVAGSDPENPGLVRIYKSPDSPNDRYENSWHTDATWREKPPFGCVLRCVECPPVGGDTMWANMALAYERLPEHDQDADRRPARAPQHRGQLRRGDADREAPRAARAVPRCRASGGAHASGDRREGPVRQRLHDPLHQLPHARTTCASARTTRTAAPQLLQYLISQAHIPEYQVRFRWKPNSVAMWDNRSTQHYAVMDYPPCHRKMERAGIVGDAAVLNRRLDSRPNTLQGPTMNFLDGSLFPENQDKLVITAAPYGPEWIPSDFPEDIPVTMEDADPEGGRLLQRRRHRAAPARARARRQGLQAPVEVQRADRRRAQGRARHDHPGRRLDLLRARDRRRRTPSGCPTTRATCWPSSIPSRTRSPSPSTPRR